jgi:hypothetical protein
MFPGGQVVGVEDEKRLVNQVGAAEVHQLNRLAGAGPEQNGRVGVDLASVR